MPNTTLMGLLQRLARLLRADVHTVLDNVEDPASILRQALRDMQDAINGNESRWSDLKGQEARLQDYRERQRNTLPPLTEQLRVCLEAEDDMLARTVIRRRLQGEQRLQRCEQTLAELARQRVALETELAGQRVRLAALQEEAEHALRCVSMQQPGRADEGLHVERAISDAEVEVMLLAEKQHYNASQTVAG